MPPFRLASSGLDKALVACQCVTNARRTAPKRWHLFQSSTVGSIFTISLILAAINNTFHIDTRNIVEAMNQCCRPIVVRISILWYFTQHRSYYIISINFIFGTLISRQPEQHTSNHPYSPHRISSCGMFCLF